MVSRSWVNAFPIENEENWFVGNRKNKIMQLALENTENTDNEMNSKNKNENIVVSNTVKKSINDNNKNKITNNILNKLKGTDEIPFRVEADLSLKNRKIVSQYDYSCTLSSKDLVRISHTSDNNDEDIINHHKKDTNNNNIIKVPIY